MNKLEKLKLSYDWSTFLLWRERKLEGIQTGIAALDKALLGLSGVTVIQGAPGCNKSTLALQVVQHNATKGNPCMIIDRENGRERIRSRLLSQANRTSQTKILTSTEEALGELVWKVDEYPIYIFTDAFKSYEIFNELLSEMWEVHKQPMLLVVDSLQSLPLITGDERTSIQTWLSFFDQAKLDWEGRLTIIITSEKSLGEGGTNYDKASLAAGKGSGAIGYKAELTLDLRRDKTTGDIICELVKNRDGHSHFSIRLSPVLEDPNNPASFCFRLDAPVGRKL